VSMAKVVFVLPPNPGLANPVLQPPLGTLYVGASIERAGHEVEIADLRDREPNVDLIPEAEWYGFSATTAEIEDCKLLAGLLKERDPKCKTVVGGPHATYLPEDCLPYFDHVVRGEGERAVVDLVEGKVGERVVAYPVEPDLDRIPFPAWHLLPEDRAFSRTLFVGERYGVGPRSAPVMSSRGCPWNCGYCGNWDRAIRYRSPWNLVAEIRELADRYGVRHYRFVDDNFILNRKRLLKIAELLEPLDVRFRAHGRSELMSREVARALVRAGCEEFAFGVETADQRVLDLVNKRERVEDHRRAIKMVKEAGMRAKTYWMVALPGETWETVELNKRFMREMGGHIDKWTLSVFCPFPGCEIFRNPRKFGITWMERDWRRYWLYQDRSLIETVVATREELDSHIAEMRRFLESGEWRG